MISIIDDLGGIAISKEELIGEFHRLKLGENSRIQKLFADGTYVVIKTFPTADLQQWTHCPCGAKMDRKENEK